MLGARFDVRRLAPGSYRAASGSAAYGQLRALTALGRATETSFRRLPDGRKVAVFRVGKRNDAGRITVSARFFQTALKDYEDWQLKWWRESIQNAVDAGSTRVECGCVEQADGTFRVWCEDNGGGMSRSTILDKFLVLGATGKEGDATATGGFGKAKEMLLLPWLSWSVTSQNTHVAGAGIDYQVRDHNPSLRGTRVEVVMPADNHTTVGKAREFIGRCYLPRVRFTTVRQDRYTNGEEQRDTETQARLKVDASVREVPGRAAIYFLKKGGRGFYVRINGIFMFDRYVSSEVQGTVIVELTGRSTDLLTANRDSIRDPELRNAFEKFTNELAADTASALEKRGKMRKLYKGSGVFATKAPRQVEADLSMATTGALQAAKRLPYGGGFAVSGETIREIMTVLSGVGDATVTGRDLAVGSAPAQVAAVTLAAVPMLGQEHIERTMKQLAWAPDFFVSNDILDWRVPEKLLPEKMAKKSLVLAKVWAELVRLVFIRLNSSEEFGVGWCFSDSVAAMYLKEQDQHWILLNPIVGTGRGPAIFDPANVEHISRLWAYAIHESTHCVDKIDWHSERFASAVTENFAKCADAWPTALRIAQAIVGGASIQLREALAVAEGGRGRGRAPAPRIVEKVVEKLVPEIRYERLPETFLSEMPVDTVRVAKLYSSTAGVRVSLVSRATGAELASVPLADRTREGLTRAVAVVNDMRAFFASQRAAQISGAA